MTITATQLAKIDYRDNLWFLSAPGLNAEMGFFSLASAGSFAGNNLNADFSLTNRAIVEMVKSGSRITCRRALMHLKSVA